MPSLTIERYALGKTTMIQIGNMASGGTEDLYETIRVRVVMADRLPRWER